MPSKTKSRSPKEIAAASVSSWTVSAPFAVVPYEMLIDKRLCKTHLRVLLMMLRHANPKGQCWPTQEHLGIGLGMREDSVRVTVRELKKFGWVVVAGQYMTKNGRLANVYQLKLPASLVKEANKYREARKNSLAGEIEDAE